MLWTFLLGKVDTVYFPLLFIAAFFTLIWTTISQNSKAHNWEQTTESRNYTGFGKLQKEFNWLKWRSVLLNKTILYPKRTLFSDMMPHSLVKVTKCFRGIYCLHLRGWRESQATGKKQLAKWAPRLPRGSTNGLPSLKSSTCSLLLVGYLLGLYLNPEEGSDMFLRNVSQLLADYMVSCVRR
jgi:hypothetical protein